jgi:plasmid stabilization system protein ParE
MSRLLIVKPVAKADIAAAKSWYAKERPGFELDFRDELSAVFNRIQNHPEAAAIVLGGIRQRAMKRFPYVISYIYEADVVFILAVLHGHRDPEMWQSRT